MTWTYESSDPSGSALNQTRFEIQDTDSSAPLLQDEEILWAISAEAGPDPDAYTPAGLYGAAARCCEALSRRFAAQADTEVGDLSATYSKQAVTYAQRAKELRERSQGLHAPASVALSRGQKEAERQDCDLEPPEFRRGQFENPWARLHRAGLPPQT